jgi:hypothetical protein
MALTSVCGLGFIAAFWEKEEIYGRNGAQATIGSQSLLLPVQMKSA